MSLVKRARISGPESSSTALIQTQNDRLTRLSSPTIQLSGHEGPVLAVKFDPSGEYIASSGIQRDIFIWKTYEDNAHLLTLSGHKRAVLDLAWSRDGSQLFSASADHTVATTDVYTGSRVRKHLVVTDTASPDSGMVNSLATVRRGTELIIAGTDAGIVAVFDPRDRFPVYTIRPRPFQARAPAASNLPVLAVATNDDGSLLFSAGIDDAISVWDPRTLGGQSPNFDKPVLTLAGHTNSVTSLRVSPDNETLLSNSMDSTTRTWNIRPFVPGSPMAAAPGATGYYTTLATPSPRAGKVLDGAPAGIESRLLRAAWSTFPLGRNGTRGTHIAAGGGDHTVALWEARSGQLLSKLPGHQGAVTDVCFSPLEPIIASASSDGTVILGEIPGLRV